MDANVVDLTPLADFFLRFWKNFVKIREKYWNWFFLKNSSIYSKRCSGHMECSFGNSANLVVPETQNILAHCPKVRTVLFLPEFRPLECSTGHDECLTDEHWVFCKSDFPQNNHQKTKSCIFLQIKFYQKVPLVTWILLLTPLLKTCATNPEFLHSKAEKNVKHIFLEKNLLSQSFSLLNIWNAVLTTPLKPFRQQNIIFSLIAHKSKSFVTARFFPRNVRLRRTRRMPTWFVHFFLKF